MVNEGWLLPLLDLSVSCSEETSQLLLALGSCGMHHYGAGERPLPFHGYIIGENALRTGGEAVVGCGVSSTVKLMYSRASLIRGIFSVSILYFGMHPSSEWMQI